MANIYKIIVNNKSNHPQDMFFFQEPAIYVGGQEIFSNSLGSKRIAAAPKLGNAQIQFQMEMQFNAGVQTQPIPIKIGESNVSSIAQIPIDISSSNQKSKNTTRMSINEGLALSPPDHLEGVEGGAFRIITPTYNPVTTPYNAGLSATADGEIVFSNFVSAEPNKNIDVQPVLKFHVATGSFQAGTVINFDSISTTSALCDASNGKEEFFVTYNLDGTWTVK